ncbi:MAG: hypothetical protein KC635_15330 [Myxococcales bacterium]|nr:hypothetical protein [Myxococcales bacterium]MCB9736786.1 hypothetical protein [Deltaproteobacteria bacterium]
MIRCQHDIAEQAHDKKGLEAPRDLRRPLFRLGFDDLIAREGRRLARLRTPEQLRAAVARLGGELRREDAPRLTAWVEAQFGTAIARQAGLAVGPPRLTLAS